MRFVIVAFIVVAIGSDELPGPGQWARADEATVRLPPAAFTDVPAPVRNELQHRDCRIPQAFTGQLPHNVIKGRFTSSAEADLAVLCSRRKVSSILVFRGGLATSVAELARQPDSSFLQVTAPNTIGFSRVLGVASPEYIRAHNSRVTGAKLPPLDHDGINDIFLEKASTVWYWTGRRWLQLSGAD